MRVGKIAKNLDVDELAKRTPHKKPLKDRRMGENAKKTSPVKVTKAKPLNTRLKTKMNPNNKNGLVCENGDTSDAGNR